MAANDPAIKDFEKALKPLHQGKWQDAASLFEKVLETEQPELAARARVYLDICENQKSMPTSTGDAYLDALMAKNRGELESAFSVCQQNLNDGDFAYLGAGIAALRGDATEAMSLLRRAIDKTPSHRVKAFHDSDFDSVRDSSEFQSLFE